MRSSLDARIAGQTVRLTGLAVNNHTTVPFSELTIAGCGGVRQLERFRIILARDVVKGVIRPGILSQRHISTRSFEATNVVAARTNRYVIIGYPMEQADRFAGQLVVIPVCSFTGRIEADMGRELDTRRCVHPAKPLVSGFAGCTHLLVSN